MTERRHATIRRAVLETIRYHDGPVIREDLPRLVSDQPESATIDPVVDELIREGEIYPIQLKNDTEVLKKT